MSDPDTPLPPHEVLRDVDPALVLDRLPAMGRIMVIGQSGGATHERIGPVETVAHDGAGTRLSGACHDAVISRDPVVTITVDRSSVMRGKSYPRLDFRDGAGAALFSVVSMDGAEGFEAAIAGFARAPAAPPEKALTPPDADRPDLSPEDPAHAPFAEAQESGAEVVIAFTKPGLRQQWRGRIEAVKPAMGFLNVMTLDFHLHLKGGTVSGWQALPGERRALGIDGQPTGLVLRSGAFA